MGYHPDSLMKRYIALLSFTDQGIAHIADSPRRAEEFCAQAEAAGIKIRALYWTQGEFDGVLAFEAPDEESATALMLKLSAGGNVRTHTLRAFPREEIEPILSRSQAM